MGCIVHYSADSRCPSCNPGPWWTPLDDGRSYLVEDWQQRGLNRLGAAIHGAAVATLSVYRRGAGLYDGERALLLHFSATDWRCSCAECRACGLAPEVTR